MTTTSSTARPEQVTEWLKRILGHEGGFQNDPNDGGNWTGGAVGRGALVGTRWGVSAASYPDLDIENLTVSRAAEIYRTDFLEPLRLDRFEDGVVFQVLDAAVNSGHDRAVRMVQRAVGTQPDGKVGPVTLAAVAAMSESDFIMRFLAERLQFLTSLPGWSQFGRGWARRIATNLRYGADDS